MANNSKDKKVNKAKGSTPPRAIIKRKRSFLSLLVINSAAIVVLLTIGAFVANHMMLTFTRHDARAVVPEFTGKVITDARRIASSMELDIIVNDSLYAPDHEGGVVLDQLPVRGTEVKPGRKIYVTINAFQAKMVDIPYVAGRSLRQALNMLEVAGLEVDKLLYEEDMATNYILAQSLGEEPITDTATVQIEVGSGINLKVGRSPRAENPLVPRLIGTTFGEAKRMLWQGGLNVGAINRTEGVNGLNEDMAMVYSQDSTSRLILPFGSEINLSLTFDRYLVDSMMLSIAAMEAEVERLRLEEELLQADSILNATIENRQTERNAEQTDIDFDTFFE